MDIKLAQRLIIPGNGDGSIPIDGPLTKIGDTSNQVFGMSNVTVGLIITRALLTLFGLGALGLLLMLILGGFKMLTSTGDPKKIDSGKQQITYAIVGFLVIVLAFWITQILATIFGVHSILTVFK